MLRNGSLRVCSDKVRVTSKIYEIAYTVCIVISLVAMLLTFITYQTFPKLRNVPGLCLMNLLAALFVANFIFLFNDDFATLPEVCVGMAALSHYTWLASFAWMSVLSYNMARTFGTHSMQLNTSSDTKTRLMKYSLYAWGLPFLVMTMGLALHFCDCVDGFVFRYGGNSTCWITDGLALFFSVGIPVAVMLTFDLIVFLYTGVSLRRSRNAVKRVRINNGSSNDLLIELAVNTRLFILLGITWIFGFVQYLWPVTVWKVVFLVSNSLQGLFIFIMFVMKKRVLKMWLDLFSTCRIEEQTPTTKAIEDIPKPSNVPAIMSQL
ncbi:putative G-protein coupled receptor Mth-like 3 [Holothuria leucospilota]|uniref:G-protein coupled receptor Mth-like 3 n=1 Tax=Holothuria leucospilota TaxID=206669 RepID=A0A9Q0YK92_HOLLE|nr:putative G-protein coupled receptor Mth-like 3 [Holothuria leucospilota]